MNLRSNVLNASIESNSASGILNPLLEVVKRDRDLILEFRRDRADIYCKGHCLNICPFDAGFEIRADEAFLDPKPLKIQSKPEAESFASDKLPFIKQRIAEHQKSGGYNGAEIEFEQALIRANNKEANLNTDYFAVDRQALLGDGPDKIDVLGIYWPRSG